MNTSPQTTVSVWIVRHTILVWFGIFLNALFIIPLLFFPRWMLDLFGIPLEQLVWARSPYLHNGSVPTLRDLLEPAAARPKKWYRGSDILDTGRVGYRSDGFGSAREDLFLYDTSVPGNGNGGHEGKSYGTELPAADKDAIVEYMKTL